VKKWPRNVIVQLRRWNYRLETDDRIKLVHEFRFPTVLRSCDICPTADEHFEYNLSAVICHIGDAESGHYIALVSGDDDQWFCCDDEIVAPFDVANLAAFTFGLPEAEPQDVEDVRTAYLLFYSRVRESSPAVVIADDLGLEIDRRNEWTCPNTYFFSGQFVKFARDAILRFASPQAAGLAFAVFFRIVLVDEQWTKE
jgi:hypothetical protein